MNPKFDFYIYPKAQEDLDSIFDYVKDSLNSPKAACDLIDRFYEAIEYVRIFPFSCPLLKNEAVENKELRKLIVDNYIIYYIPNEKEKKIEIVRVSYGRRNITELF